MKKLVSFLIIGALAAAMSVSLAGCGEDEFTSVTSAVVPATNSTQAVVQTQPTKSVTDTSKLVGQSETFVYAGMTEQEAGEEALKHADANSSVVSAIPGFDNTGAQCWIVGTTVSGSSTSYFFVKTGSTVNMNTVITGFNGGSTSGSSSDKQSSSNEEGEQNEEQNEEPNEEHDNEDGEQRSHSSQTSKKTGGEDQKESSDDGGDYDEDYYEED